MKDIAFFDLETTGTDVVQDRIVSIYIKRIGSNPAEFYSLVNPGIRINPKATEVHGISDDMVKDAPTIHAIKDKIVKLFEGADIGGYNVNFFDIPMLSQELFRAEYKYFPDPIAEVYDMCTVFKTMEQRTLTAALKFYCGKDMEGAHDARFDVDATIDVFYGQMKHYGFTPERIAEITAEQMKGRLDVTNKFAYNENGEICFNFGKNKGLPARKDPSYLKWMLAGEFHYSAKTICENVLREIEK